MSKRNTANAQHDSTKYVRDSQTGKHMSKRNTANAQHDSTKYVRDSQTGKHMSKRNTANAQHDSTKYIQLTQSTHNTLRKAHCDHSQQWKGNDWKANTATLTDSSKCGFDLRSD